MKTVSDTEVKMLNSDEEIKGYTKKIGRQERIMLQLLDDNKMTNPRLTRVREILEDSIVGVINMFIDIREDNFPKIRKEFKIQVML